ncbi:SAM-dependent methyltransferase [Fimbriiglobus ruber]|uniref:SAM-dependent methyltransferase n=1 Tax=Fimbriiglobus ruber TaxID=1908690 RepID=A0A225DY90_9BACT|nr:SAM-dependent methyltransferase [Fimbriiglobus ruber]
MARALLPADAGFYIAVGSGGSVEESVTAPFYDSGWSGINVEAQEEPFQRLTAARPRDCNLPVVLAEKSGTCTLYAAPTRVGWATASAVVAADLAASGITVYPREVRAATLAEVCAEYVRGEISFLKIDASGEERGVLLGGDFRTWRPRVVLFEGTRHVSSAPNFELWEDVLLDSDYQFATRDGTDRYYVRAEDEALIPALQVPADALQAREYQSRLLAAEAEAADSRRMLAALQAQVVTAGREIEALRAKLADQTRESASVREQRDAALETAGRVQAEIEALKTEAAVRTGDREALLAAHAALRGQFEAVRARLTNFRKAFTPPNPPIDKRTG